jgi:hypothetical protein
MDNKIQFSNLSIEKDKELGSGYISKVFKAIDKLTKKEYAVKIVLIKRSIFQKYPKMK